MMILFMIYMVIGHIFWLAYIFSEPSLVKATPEAKLHNAIADILFMAAFWLLWLPIVVEDRLVAYDRSSGKERKE